MSIYRRAQRRDDGEQDIVDALERVGAKVKRMSLPCDLAVLFRGRHYLIEVNGSTKYRRREPKQIETLTEMEIPIINRPEEALRVIGAMS